MSALTVTKKKLSFKAQTASAVAAAVCAAALPQIFHLAGLALGLGSALGEAFLPMHLPVILVGFWGGAYAGALAGAAAPLLSFALSGMPSAEMLAFMTIELFCYGLFAGLLKDKQAPVLAKLVLTQLSGRAVRAAAILLAVYALKRTGVSASIIWTSIAKGIPGLALQWCLIPLALHLTDGRNKNER